MARPKSKKTGKAKAKTTTKKAAAKKTAKVTKKAAGKKTTAKAKTAKASTPKVKRATSASPAAAAETRVGEVVPDFKLLGTNGEMNLSALRGKKVVLYFYPKDATPGCTIEGHDFSRLLGDFQQAGAEVFGVSRDTLSSHEKFRTKENYKVHLLSDSDELTCNRFGVIKDKNMYGKKVRGIERSTFVIDADGRLAKEWRKVSVEGHAEEVLNYIKTI